MPFLLTTDPKKKLFSIIAFFFFLYLVIEITNVRSQLSPDIIKDLFLAQAFWGIALFCLAFTIGNLLYVPGLVFLVGAVYALGKEWGGVATFSAAMCSAMVSFVLIRSVGGPALRSFNNKWADKIFAHLDKRPILSITLLRLLFQTLPALNYALALSGVRFGHYVVGTFLGLPLPLLVYCYFFEIIFQQLIKN